MSGGGASARPAQTAPLRCSASLWAPSRSRSPRALTPRCGLSMRWQQSLSLRRRRGSARRCLRTCAPRWLSSRRHWPSGPLQPCSSSLPLASRSTPPSTPAGSRRGVAAWRRRPQALPPTPPGAQPSSLTPPPLPFQPGSPAAAAAARQLAGQVSPRRPLRMSWQLARPFCRGWTHTAARSLWCRPPGGRSHRRACSPPFLPHRSMLPAEPLPAGRAGLQPAGCTPSCPAAAARRRRAQSTTNSNQPQPAPLPCRHDMRQRDLAQTKRLIAYVLDTACATADARRNPAGQISCLFDLSGALEGRAPLGPLRPCRETFSSGGWKVGWLVSSKVRESDRGRQAWPRSPCASHRAAGVPGRSLACRSPAQADPLARAPCRARRPAPAQPGRQGPAGHL